MYSIIMELRNHAAYRVIELCPVTQLKQHQATKKLELPAHLVGLIAGLLQQSPN